LPKSCEQPYRTEQQSAYGTPSNRAFKSFNAVLIRNGDLRDIVEVIETAGVISPWEVNQSRIEVRVRDSSTRITSVNVDLGHWAVWPFAGAASKAAGERTNRHQGRKPGDLTALRVDLEPERTIETEERVARHARRAAI
jgi:hypothetical protein